MMITSEMIPVLPRYQRSPRANVFEAVFPTRELRVETGRKRRYPGLLGLAPDTRALYDAAAQLLAGAERVLDFGCGSGLGTAELRCHFQRVTAVDCDAAAVEFASAYLRSVDVLADDGSQVIEQSRQHDAVVVIDVLGQSATPEAALRAARRWLSPGGRLFLAEGRAFPSQALLAPVQRAFSQPSLITLLVRAGLELEQWVEGAGNFLVCVARPAKTDHHLRLAEADAALAAGEPVAALLAYDSVPIDAPHDVRTEALLGRAELLAAGGDLSAACQSVLDAAALSPGNARTLAGLSEVSFITGEKQQAIELAISALEHDPCEPTAVQCLARAASTMGADDAFASWRIANGLTPGDVSVASELSCLAAQRGEMMYAIWVLERLREFRTDLGADYHVTLAWLYLNAGRAGEARLEAEIARVQDAEHQGVKELWAHLAA